MEADRGAPTETERPSSSRANGNKGKGKAKVKPEATAFEATAQSNPSHSQRPSRTETPAPNPSQQQSVEPEEVTGSGRRPKRTIKPPKKYEDEGDIMEEQRERTPSTGKVPAGAAKTISPARNAPGSGATLVVDSSSDLRHPAAEAPASASKKNNKATSSKKAPTNTAIAEADSPVASIEENDEEMDSSQKTVVDLEVADALAKREEARRIKSEKMKAITKARWASGEMHSVMEKKKANNALKKAALSAGASHTPIAIAPAPLNLAAAPPKLAAAKKATSGSRSPASTPITPTLGSFTSKGKGKGVIKPEPKKEPRAKVLAKQEGNTHKRARSMDMDGSSDDRELPTSAPVKKLSEYEIFQQLSSSANLEDSDGKGTRARSLAYEGRRSGRGGSLGGVGMERTISDDGASLSNHRQTPTQRISKTVPRKLSEYEMFQQISSPSAAGSPLPPRGRRPAALRATQTFGRFAEDEDVEEETIPYAGPPGGHRRTQSADVKKEVKAKKVIKDEESDEESESEEEKGPKRKTLYDEWQEIIRGTATKNAETEEGKRTRLGGRKSEGAR